jgi:hypothetical protein
MGAQMGTRSPRSCMNQIPLTRNLVVTVSRIDFPRLSRFSWFAQPGRRGTFYAARQVRIRPRKQRIRYMHHDVLNVPGSVRIDHRDGNDLNTTRRNLRVATTQQNRWNSQKQAGAVSTYKGVSLVRPGSWKAELTANKVHHYLGVFPSEADAGRAYDVAAKKFFGKFARLNFP